MKAPRLLVVFGLAVALAGCGGNKAAEPATSTTTTTAKTTEVRVYWLRDGKVWPVGRDVDTANGLVNGAVAQLLVGPTDQEKSALGAKTAIPGSVTKALIATSAGVATVKVSGELSKAALAQLVYTLTQFPTVDSVSIAGRSYTRANFEEQTPAILVESPLAFETVSSPLRARGTANTFEATFDYDVTDARDKVVAHDFVTATSGNGMRGTFELSAPLANASAGPGKLVVYEVSAANGKRIHQVEIPLQLRAS
jgi:germination protein M